MTQALSAGPERHEFHGWTGGLIRADKGGDRSGWPGLLLIRERGQRTGHGVIKSGTPICVCEGLISKAFMKYQGRECAKCEPVNSV